MEKMPSTLMTENHTTRADILMFGNEATKLDRHRPDSSSPGQKDSSFCKQDEKLESTRVEMGEVKRENERLKAILARIMKDYQSLQTQLSSMVPQELDKKPDLENTGIPPGAEESGLVSLSLGTSPRGSKEVEKTATSGKTEEDAPMNEGLALGLDCRFDRGGGASSEDDQWKYWRHEKSPDQEPKEEDAGGLPRPPSQALKTTSRPGDGEVPQQAQVIKKARVSLRARCDTPTVGTNLPFPFRSI